MKKNLFHNEHEIHSPLESPPTDVVDDSSTNHEHGRQSKIANEDMGDATLNSTIIYPVAIGRCVELFKSATTVFASTSDFPGQIMKKYKSERDTVKFLTDFGVHNLKRYWLAQYDSGSLLANPEAVIGENAYFPVGGGIEIYHECGKGKVEGTLIHNDNRMWKVRLPNGYQDIMPEWLLLCGIAEYRAYSHDDKQRRNRIFAIRGSIHDGKKIRLRHIW